MESIVFLGQEPKKTPCPRFQIQILLNKKFKPLSSQCCWMSISQSLSTTKEGEERLLATGGWSRTGLVAPVLHLCLCWHHFSLLATVLLAVILAAAPPLSLCPFLQPEPLGWESTYCRWGNGHKAGTCLSAPVWLYSFFFRRSLIVHKVFKGTTDFITSYLKFHLM